MFLINFRNINKKMNQGSKHKLLEIQILWVYVWVVKLVFNLYLLLCHTFRLFQHGEISQDQAAPN